MSKKETNIKINNVTFRFLTWNDIEYIKKNYKTKRIGEIAKKIGTSDNTITKVFKALEIDCWQYNGNKKYRKIGNRKFLASRITDEKINWLKKNYQLPMKQLSKYINLNQDSLKNLLNELGIKRERLIFSKLPYTNNEFMQQLENQSISNSELAYKYNVTTDAIRNARKIRGLNGYQFRGRSILEVKVCEILDKLDLAYIEQKRINKWSVDFYLGNKIVIEVDGEIVHKKPQVIEKDKRKNNWFLMNDYTMIYIQEKDIDICEKIICNKLKGVFHWI